jgi:transcriptional regulator with XRE-family HTH domain
MKSHMTQYRIAKELGVSEQAVSKWYTGKSLPSPQNLAALSRLLGKDMETLLNELLKCRSTRRGLSSL